MSDVSVRVRISDFLTDRRYAICVDRPEQLAWVIDVAVARKLHRDLGEALEAVGRLEPFDVAARAEEAERAEELAGEPGR